MKNRIITAIVATVVLASFGTGAAFAVSDNETTAGPTLAQTGYDFTPMLVTAAVFLLIAGVAVLIAKYAVARSRH